MNNLIIAFFVVVTLILSGLVVECQAVTFSWDANTDNTVGYIVYFNEKGDTDTPFNTGPIIHPTIEVTVENLHITPGVVYEAWATAYNDRGESDKSNIVEFSIDPFTPPVENLPVIIDFPSAPGTFRI